MAYEVKKDPNADLDYGFDWTAWLGATDTITESTWSVPRQRTHDAWGVDFDERQGHHGVAQSWHRISPRCMPRRTTSRRPRDAKTNDRCG